LPGTVRTQFASWPSDAVGPNQTSTEVSAFTTMPLLPLPMLGRVALLTHWIPPASSILRSQVSMIPGEVHFPSAFARFPPGKLTGKPGPTP